MGNQLAAVAPQQIFPVEYYMNDINDLIFDKNLGSTRFFKVARAQHPAGLMVVKVFTVQDPGVNLNHDRDKLLEIKRLLEGCPNCLAFQRAVITDKAGFIVRQYLKDSLYDRISTRPFLTLVEKKWIAFQILLALQQAHKHKICHGDIKLENVMITSWNWVILTDFASFKPTYLPDDNPADFSYFFDTSRRRTCYVAPERFRAQASGSSVELNASTSSDGQSLPSPTGMATSQYLPDSTGGSVEEVVQVVGAEPTTAMDIFSAGCVLIELFTEGSPPFSFSQLLAYRNGAYNPEKILNKIEDGEVRALLEHMIQLDPSKRFSANQYLTEERGKTFPNFFYTFAQAYMQIFSTDPSLLPDHKISKINENINGIVNMVNNASSGDFDERGMILINSLVSSNVRPLKFCSARVDAMEMLGKIAEHLSSEIILDRVVPYMVTQLSEPSYPSVRIAAFENLTKCVKYVKHIPASDANIFPEYILPSLLPLCHDRNAMVRASFASNIADIAQQSVRFLDLVLLTGVEDVSKIETSDDDQDTPSYDTELLTLHDYIGQAVTVLLSDNVNFVKQALMDHGVTKLAVFFGKQKANDFLLSHMITFLNDKEDSKLRCSFYENIVGVAAFVGWQCSPILKPLLQQGLSDPEEYVVARCISTMASLTSLGLLQKVALNELQKETAPLLLHPNPWVRHEMAGFVAASAEQMDAVDTAVKLGSILKPFLARSIHQIQKPVLLLGSLESPIPRNVFDIAVKSSFDTLVDLFNHLEERQSARQAAKSTNVKHLYSEIPSSIRTLFRRMVSEGMVPSEEDKLTFMKDYLQKTARQKATVQKNVSSSITVASSTFYGGQSMVSINTGDSKNLSLRSAALDVEITSLESSSSNGTDLVNEVKPSLVQLKISRMPSTQPLPDAVNEEWKQMFGGDSDQPSTPKQCKHSRSASPLPTILPERSESPVVGETKAKEKLKPNKRNKGSISGMIDNVTPVLGPLNTATECKSELQGLVTKKRLEFGVNAKKDTSIMAGMSCKNTPPTGWKPKGYLVAHLHEHQEYISKLVRIPDTPLFVSGSADGCVRIWDCSKFEGTNVANTATVVINQLQESAITTLASDGSGRLLASSSENGSIAIFNLETQSVVQKKLIDVDDEGPAIAFHFCDTGRSSPLLNYSTPYGAIVGWDLRCPPDRGEAYRMELDLRDGIQTATAVSSDQCWVVSGTSSGVLTCWDLRFRLPIFKCTHPSEARIRDLLVPSRHQNNSSVWASVQGCNEVGLWNLESQYRQLVLWPSTAPLLASTSSGVSCNTDFISSICSVQGNGLNVLLTAGTDRRIRYWDLMNYQESSIVAGAGNEMTTPSQVTYKSKIVDGTEVVQEINSKPKNVMSPAPSTKSLTNTDPNQSLSNRPGLDGPSLGHLNWISSLTLCQSNSWYVVSGSRDGVIKVWR